jgi:hypothetical protein
MHDLEAAARQNGLHNLQRQGPKKNETCMIEEQQLVKMDYTICNDRGKPKKKNHNLTRIMRTNLTCNKQNMSVVGLLQNLLLQDRMRPACSAPADSRLKKKKSLKRRRTRRKLSRTRDQQFKSSLTFKSEREFIFITFKSYIYIYI